MNSRYTCTEIQGIQNDSRVWKKLAGFLREQQLEVTGPPEHTVIIKDEGSIIATGSRRRISYNTWRSRRLTGVRGCWLRS